VELVVGDLVLRPPHPGDLAAVVTACQDSEISRFIPLVPVPYTREDGRAWLEAVERGWRDSDEQTFAILDGKSAAFLGVVTVRLGEESSVGYWLTRSARGRGVMTEALKAIVAWARAEHGIQRLFLTAHPDNTASQRVAEKAGFTRAGLTEHRPPFRDGTTVAIRFELG
jgi:RimJ/RimL family protein N-acetyltransferase